MGRKMYYGILLTLLLIGVTATALIAQPVKAQARPWIVDYRGTADFTKIQDAINAADPGDYIYVINGTYVENVVVNKTLWLIGEDQEITIIDGGATGTVVNVTADNVVISNFAIRNSGSLPDDAAIRLEGSEGSVINNNNVTSNPCNIHLIDSNTNTIIHNIMRLSSDCGLNLTNSDDNNIALNLISDNSVGISLGADSGGNIITRNNITSNTLYGILATSGGNIVYHNNFIGNTEQVVTDSINTWDNSTVPLSSGGNYWSNYTGVDSNGDRIGDTPHEINPSNVDNYPLKRAASTAMLLVDLNDDRVINMRDIGLVVQAYGSYPFSSKWNFLADVNADLRVDLKDIGSVAMNFAKSYP